MNDLPHVFFDCNRGTEKHGYPLIYDASKADLALIGDDLSVGLQIIIYMSDEFEMQAVLDYDTDEACWVAKPIAGTIVYLDDSASKGDES